MQTWTYTDETHSDWNRTVYQVKLSQYFFTFQNDLQKQNWDQQDIKLTWLIVARGGGPRVVVSTAAFHARVQGLVPGLGGLKET